MGVFLDVGLTGGISCGKSTVLRMFAVLGCFTLDADSIYHELIGQGGPIYNKVVEHFGEGVVDGRQRIDRVALGEIVFNDPDALAKLNAISHPIIVEEQERLKAEIRKKHEGGIIITDAALMIEAGTYKRYDKVVVVTCEEELQLQRLMRRAAIGEKEAGKRIAAQMTMEEKLRYADYVIHNDDSIEALKREVEDVYNYLHLDLKAKGRGHV
jgi:dephospho-CoA kinase